MIFVGASVLCALMLRESDADDWADALDHHPRRLFCAVGYWETVAAVCRVDRLSPDEAAMRVDTLLRRLDFELVPIGERESRLAVEAARDFGRGRHPAALNMGDCFSYACAKSLGTRLLYRGNDFAQTDLA